MIETRPINEAELDQFIVTDSLGFGLDLPAEGDKTLRDWLVASGALGQTIAAFESGSSPGQGGSAMVGTLTSFDFDLTVPGGGQIPLAGTSWVSVLPTHRRRGVLNQMMSHHLDQARRQAKVVAGLWASDERIYGRFGYGPACQAVKVGFNTDQVGGLIPAPEVNMVLVDRQQERDLLPSLHASTLGRHPGALSRSRPWWNHTHFEDRSQQTNDRGERRVVVARTKHIPEGYAVYRLKSAWSPTGVAMGELEVVEMGYASDPIRRALWHYLASIDLYPNVTATVAPDDPITVEAGRPRLLSTSTTDSLWLRLLDVPRALQARHYEVDDHLTIRLVDPFYATEQVYSLEVDGGRGQCHRVNAEPDISLDEAVLARLYLGGGSTYQLARAGLIQADHSSIVRLGRLFQTAQAPFCPDFF